MKIGDTIVVVEEFIFNSRKYKIGDKFKIIGDSGQRGWDIEDDNGNIIYETLMIYHHFESIKEQRKAKIKRLNESK